VPNLIMSMQHLASLGLAATLFAAGCRPAAEIQPGDIRSYVAPKAAAPLAAETKGGEVPSVTSTGPRITYDLPEGWVDAGGGGLRLATLRTGQGTGADVDEVTIIAASGSLEGNVARWQEQLTPGGSAEAVERALASAERVETADGTATIVLLEDGAAEDRQAILAAMLPIDESGAIFVKLKGSADRARTLREPFTSLVRSIRLR
jgi:hypothetical protein